MGWCYLRRWLGCSIDFAFSAQNFAENPKKFAEICLINLPLFACMAQGHFVSQVQDFTHLKYETSKESTRDCEKVGHSETEDETGKLAVSKSEMRNH